MQDAAQQLLDFMNKKGLSQCELAKKARVSQASVSRALQGKGPRHGRARKKLFIYAGICDAPLGFKASDPRSKVMAAFERIWDSSDAHAEVVANVINALAGLKLKRPKS